MNEKRYPYIGRHHSGLQVYFTEPGVGIVLVEGDDHKIKEKRSDWLENSFKCIENFKTNDIDKGDEIVKKGDFIIGSINGANVSFANQPKVHSNFMSASQEAERLAKSSPGKQFVVVEIKGIVQVQNVVWS